MLSNTGCFCLFFLRGEREEKGNVPCENLNVSLWLFSGLAVFTQGGSEAMRLLWFQFSLHLATGKLDPWFGLWLGVGGEEERSWDPIPTGGALPAPQRHRQRCWG